VLVERLSFTTLMPRYTQRFSLVVQRAGIA
jgi:hypothetical protein